MLKGLLRILEKGDIELAIKKLEEQLNDADKNDYYIPIDWD